MIRKIVSGMFVSAAVLATTPVLAQLSLGGSAKAQVAGQAVDVNTASVGDLQKLGFSHKQAKQIVAAAKADAFDTVDELKAELSFVTDPMLAQLKGQLQVGTSLVGGVAAQAGGLVGGATSTVGGAVGGLLGGAKATAATALNVNTASAAQLKSLGFNQSSIDAILAAQPGLDSLPELKAAAGADANLVDKLSASGQLTLQ